MEKQVRLHVRVKAITVNGSVETDSGKVVGTFSRDIPSDRLDEVVTVDEPEPEPLAEWERELLEPPPPPFPNDPMVIAEGRLWIRDLGGHYWLPDISEWRSPFVRFKGDAIPVQVVSAGAYEALLARLDESRPDRTANQRRVVVTRAAEQLRDCTDALRWRA